jgi:hypothetical protein
VHILYYDVFYVCFVLACSSLVSCLLVTVLCQVKVKGEVEVEVTLRLTVSQPICLGIEYRCGTCDQILFPVGMLLSEICCLVSIGRPL